MKTYSHGEIAQMEKTNWWYVARRDLLAEIMRRNVSSGKTALDLGCGVGSNLEVIRPFAPHVTGLDISAEALLYVKEKGYDATLESSATTIPLADHSIDIILCADMIEHVDDALAVKEMARVLTSGGVVVCTTPAFSSLWNDNDDYGQHLRRYSRGQFLKVFTEGGFEVRWVNYWNVMMFFPVWVVARFHRKKKEGDHPENNLSRVPVWLNGILLTWLQIEQWLVLRFPMPFGVSHIAVFRYTGKQ